MLYSDDLTSPSDELSDFVCSVFAQTEVIDKQISYQQHVECSECVLSTCVTIDK